MFVASTMRIWLLPWLKITRDVGILVNENSFLGIEMTASIIPLSAKYLRMGISLLFQVLPLVIMRTAFPSSCKRSHRYIQTNGDVLAQESCSHYKDTISTAIDFITYIQFHPIMFSHICQRLFPTHHHISRFSYPKIIYKKTCVKFTKYRNLIAEKRSRFHFKES